jgi:hypothetical protein
MSKLDPKLRKALKDLSNSLSKAGYAPDEQEAIVEGASEHVTEFLETHPDSRIDEALELISSYKNPQFEPDFQSVEHANGTLGRYAWMALAVAVLGMTLAAPLIDMAGGDGGTIILLFAMIALPLAGILAYLSRRTKLGRMAGYTTCCVAALVFVVIFAFI